MNRNLITNDIMNYVFTDGIETSISYWAKITDYGVSNLCAKLELIEEVEFYDNVFDVNISTVKKGFDKLFDFVEGDNVSKSKWALRVLNNFINEDYDAEDCDIVFQLGVFNDVIFG